MRHLEQMQLLSNTQLRDVQGDLWKAQEVSYSHAPLFATGQVTARGGLVQEIPSISLPSKARVNASVSGSSSGIR
jgi:hypothetical protein